MRRSSRARLVAMIHIVSHMRMCGIKRTVGAKAPTPSCLEEKAGMIGTSLGRMAQDVMSIPAAAAVITAKVAQPKYLSNGEFTRLPITLWLLVRRIADFRHLEKHVPIPN